MIRRKWAQTQNCQALWPLSDNGIGFRLGTESLNIGDIVKTPGVVFYRDLSFLEHVILCLSSELQMAHGSNQTELDEFFSRSPRSSFWHGHFNPSYFYRRLLGWGTRGSYQTKINIYENNNLFLLQTTLKTTATILQLV